jgi:hypothetical protein
MVELPNAGAAHMSSKFNDIPIHPQSIRILDGLVSMIAKERRPAKFAKDLGFLVLEDAHWGDIMSFWDEANAIGEDPILHLQFAMIQEVVAREALRAFKPIWDVTKLSGTYYACYRALRASGSCNPATLESCAAERMALIQERYAGVFEAEWLYMAIGVVFKRSFVVPQKLNDLD